ncbi:MAG TPA: CBS domain-containing protein [Bacteroidia bacterium]|nr:CBS domain-containing protein [Bacteroidia bacterium]
MKVGEIMIIQDLQYCTPETFLRDAAAIMKTAGVSALPVVDAERQVIGIVTDRDIDKLPVQKQAPERIRDIVAHKAVTVSAGDELTFALRQMRAVRIARLPVVDGEGRLEGILCIHHLLAESAGNRKVLGGLSLIAGEILKTVTMLSNKYTGHNSLARMQKKRKE